MDNPTKPGPIDALNAALPHKTEQNQAFDELTAAIAGHNIAVAQTIVQAQKSLSIAKNQLKYAEDALDNLKQYIVDVVVNGKK